MSRKTFLVRTMNQCAKGHWLFKKNAYKLNGDKWLPFALRRPKLVCKDCNQFFDAENF